MKFDSTAQCLTITYGERDELIRITAVRQSITVIVWRERPLELEGGSDEMGSILERQPREGLNPIQGFLDLRVGRARIARQNDGQIDFRADRIMPCSADY